MCLLINQTFQLTQIRVVFLNISMPSGLLIVYCFDYINIEIIVKCSFTQFHILMIWIFLTMLIFIVILRVHPHNQALSTKQTLLPDNSSKRKGVLMTSVASTNNVTDIAHVCRFKTSDTVWQRTETQDASISNLSPEPPYTSLLRCQQTSAWRLSANLYLVK